jgi:2-phosphosulfolactate phosphatase
MPSGAEGCYIETNDTNVLFCRRAMIRSEDSVESLSVTAPALRVHFLPALVKPEDLAGGVCLVIDVLRATTTISYALAAGAREVIPVQDIEAARATAARFPPGEALLGGERGGVRIEGFDCGNSPSEYTAERIGGKTLVFSTTNGTKAMRHCRHAAAVLIAGFVNSEAICRTIEDLAPEQLDILCAGTDGQITREDVLLAGMLVHRLESPGEAWTPNDQAILAFEAWSTILDQQVREQESLDAVLTRELRNTQGGRNLTRLGLTDDIAAAAKIDSINLAPFLDVPAGHITTGRAGEQA